MPTISQLRERTQKGKIVGRERPWLYKTLQRGPSIYITALLIKTSISPNMISTLSILVGILGAVAVVGPHLGWVCVGIVLCYAHLLLDKVDGELARYYNRHSLRGIFLDEINHLLVPPLFFIGMMLQIVFYMSLPLVSGILVLLGGIAAALAMSFIRTGWSLAPQIFAKKYLKRPHEFSLPEQDRESRVSELKQAYTCMTKLLQLIHQFQEFLMILLVFFIATVLQMVVSAPILPYLIMIYGVLLPFIFIENTVKGYWAIESRIRDLRDRFLK